MGDFCHLWWSKHLITELGRQKQVALSEFEASLVYLVNSKPVRDIQ